MVWLFGHFLAIWPFFGYLAIFWPFLNVDKKVYILRSVLDKSEQISSIL